MRRIWIFLASVLATTYAFGWYSNATHVHANFALGAFSQDNHIEEFVQREKIQGMHYQIVAFTYDTFTPIDGEHLQKAIDTLGQDRVYHISISPYGLSAEQVANGEYDGQYERFFEIVKKSWAKFVFRTMHEMNGSWYSWSGDPENFKRAWKRIYELSRNAGLSKENVLFVMSVNSQDLPSKDNRINGELVFCTPEVKKLTPCLTMEDYYPWDKYVDLMGITLYNWWRGRPESWATWRTFEELLMDWHTKMYERLVAYHKPVFIDEVGTTAVDFEGTWSNRKVMEGYQSGTSRKNTWIQEMKESIKNHPEIVGAVYFNRDKTYELSDRSIAGELDWAIVSPMDKKVYTAYFDIFQDVTCTIQAIPFARTYATKDVTLEANILAKKVLPIWFNSTKTNATERKKILRKVSFELQKLKKKEALAKNIKMKQFWKSVSTEFTIVVTRKLHPEME